LRERMRMRAQGKSSGDCDGFADLLEILGQSTGNPRLPLRGTDDDVYDHHIYVAGNHDNDLDDNYNVNDDHNHGSGDNHDVCARDHDHDRAGDHDDAFSNDHFAGDDYDVLDDHHVLDDDDHALRP
jgi:hypothetical protein